MLKLDQLQFNVMSVICMRMRKSSTVDYISDMVTLNLLEKEWIEMQIHLSNYG